jgi:hypothetical protein
LREKEAHEKAIKVALDSDKTIVEEVRKDLEFQLLNEKESN